MANRTELIEAVYTDSDEHQPPGVGAVDARQRPVNDQRTAQQTELATRWQQTRCPDALASLEVLTRRLRFRMARRHAPNTDEANSAADFGFMKAVAVFDPAIGTFSAVLDFKIHAELQTARRQGEVVKTPRGGERARYASADGDDVLGTATPDYEARDVAARAAASWHVLTDREASVMQAVYLDGATEAEAARALGVHQTIVSRSHGRALTKLRAVIRAS